MMRSVLWMVTLALAGTASSAHAQQPANEASTARLGSLGPEDRERIAPHLDDGPVAFVEFATRTELPAVLVATRVHAPAKKVASVISAPKRYPQFMPALDSVELRSRHAQTIVYDWTWQTAIFTLKGRNTMSVYAPAPGDRKRGYRIGVRSVRGDFGKGRMMWRIYPEDGGTSLLVLAMRVDMREANYVSKKLSAGGNSVNRTINISLGFVMLLGTKEEVERRVGWEDPDARGAPSELHRPEVDLQKLAPMLARGDLMFLEMHGERVAQVSIVGRMGKPRKKVRKAMTNPEAFGRALVDGSRAEVVDRDGGATIFEWAIPLPLVGSSGRMRIEERDSTVAVDATQGNLSGGRWRFDTHTFPWGEAGVVGWARFDPTDASWLLKRLASSIRWFDHGLTAASQVMVIRSIRARVWNRLGD